MRRAAPPSSAGTTTGSGRACARVTMAMNSDRRAYPSDVLRPKNVGAPIKRTEDPRLLTGNGEYTADRKPDRPLHLAFLRSGQPHAKIARIDTAAATEAPGVVAVLTAEDIAGRVQAGDPVLADAELLCDADSAARLQEGPLRRRGRRRDRRHLAIPRRGRARTDRCRIRTPRRDLARGTGRGRRRSASARRSGHERPDRARIQKGRCRRRSEGRRGQGGRALRNDAQGAARNGAAQLRGRVRKAPRRNHAIHLVEHSRHRPRRDFRVARPAGQPPARRRAGRRRKLRIEGIALS